MAEYLGTRLQPAFTPVRIWLPLPLIMQYALTMARFMIHARSEDGLSGEDMVIVADSEEQAIAKYEMGVGQELPLVTAEFIGN